MVEELWPILLRVAITFFVLLVLTRLTGKKQLSQGTFFDFITAIALGDIAGERLADPNEPLVPWLLGTLLWFALIIAFDLLVLSSRRVAKVLEGEPTILIENGRILQQNLRSTFLRVDELMAHLRTKGYFSPSDVENALFEIDGSISVQPRSQRRPVTPADLRIPTSYEGIAREVVVEGQIIHHNLEDLRLNEGWLLAALQRQGYDDPADVFYAALETSGRLYIDGYNDAIPGIPVDVKDYGPH